MKFKTQHPVHDTGDIFHDVVTRRMARRSFLNGALLTAPPVIAGPTLLLRRKSQAVNSSNIDPSTTTEPYLLMRTLSPAHIRR
jgi:hypothetical protein